MKGPQWCEGSPGFFYRLLEIYYSEEEIDHLTSASQLDTAGTAHCQDVIRQQTHQLLVLHSHLIHFRVN